MADVSATKDIKPSGGCLWEDCGNTLSKTFHPYICQEKKIPPGIRTNPENHTRTGHTSPLNHNKGGTPGIKLVPTGNDTRLFVLEDFISSGAGKIVKL